MSSGSYFPLRRCGGLNLPKGRWTDPAAGHFQRSATESHRKSSNEYLEPILEPIFHDDSYGYRPGRSAIPTPSRRPDSVAGNGFDWVLDIDVQSYFDGIDWERLLKAVRHHTDCPWALLYSERWLKAPRRNEGR